MVVRAGHAERFEIDSAGTHAYHLGESPDPRAVEAARKRGIAIGQLRARQVDAADFEYFDYLLAMDHDNLRVLRARCPVNHYHKLHLFLSWVKTPHPGEVPDPYYGGEQGFERVLDLLEQGALALFQQILAVE